MNCTETRGLLSDLLDMRRGEIPGAENCLSQSAVHMEAESHLSTCDACRGEMNELEEIGKLFSEFSVGELPVQHFENYGALIRNRARSERKIVPLRRAGSIFFRVAASAGVAACLALAVFQFMPAKKDKKVVISPRSTSYNTAALTFPKTYLPSVPLTVANGFVSQVNQRNILPPQVPNDRHFNGNSAEDLKQISQEEGLHGFLVLGERVKHGESTLLGLQLRTTRDEDKDLSKKELPGLKIFAVEDGSVAQEMGLMRGDLMVAINNKNVDNGGAEDAAKILAGVLTLGKGAPVSIDVVRRVGGEMLYLQVHGKLGEPHAPWLPTE